MTDTPARDAVIYHLFPLGALGAPAENGPDAGADRIPALHAWLDHIEALGADTILLGPVVESGTHGYDTVDLFRIDKRLGTNEAFADWRRAARSRGFRIVLDGVFHHVGRGFAGFRDVQEKGRDSAYRDWFHLDFGRRSARGDAFAYEGWNGHDDLVKLDTGNPEVRKHLFDAVRFWIETFEIDGLRLDAADVLDIGFQRALAEVCRALKPDFWLMGEVIHGDYGHWIRDGALDSVTNYEVYKGLYSSHNDGNYFEIAHSLNRQFGEGGIYRGLDLCNFVDNHDVARIASRLDDPRHLYPLHVLLFAIPGIPAIYYGSECGVPGRKRRGSDASLRPALDPRAARSWGEHPDLAQTIARLIRIRRAHPVLREGRYTPLHVASRQFAFLRESGGERAIVAVNADHAPARLELSVPGADRRFADALGEGGGTLRNGRIELTLDPCWGRILV